MSFGSYFLIISAFVLVVLLLVYRVKVFKFIAEVKVELEKCSWPWDPAQTGFKKYKELVDSTVIVVIAMLLLSGYIAFWDFILLNVVTGLTH